MDNLFFVLFALSAVLFLVLIIFSKKKTDKIKKFFPVQFSKEFKFGQIIYFLGFFFLLISLLDLKGPYEKVKTKKSAGRIIFLVDFSASMRAEDLKGNRAFNAISLLRDILDDLQGNYIGLSIFSDRSYRLVPFSKDTEYIKGQLKAIQNNLWPDGGSDMHIALEELYRSFELEKKENVTLIVLSDFENINQKKVIKFFERDNISPILIGVGTKRGSYLKMSKGSYTSTYLMKGGEKILSKLNIKFLSKLPYPAYRLDDQNFPSDKLIQKIKETTKKRMESVDDDFLAPRQFHYFIISAIICFIASFFLRRYKFGLASIAIILSFNIYAQENKTPPPIDEVFPDDLARLEEGDLSAAEKHELALKMFDEKYKKEPLILLKDNANDPDILIEGSFNLATGELKSGKLIDGLKRFKKLDEKILSSRLIIERRRNIIKLLKDQQKKSKKQQKKGGQKPKQGKGGPGNQQEQPKSNNNGKKDLSQDDREVIKKLLEDDGQSQSDYFKKKITNLKKKGGVQW